MRWQRGQSVQNTVLMEHEIDRVAVLKLIRHFIVFLKKALYGTFLCLTFLRQAVLNFSYISQTQNSK